MEPEKVNEIKIPQPKVLKKGFTLTHSGNSKMKKVRSFDTLKADVVETVGNDCHGRAIGN